MLQSARSWGSSKVDKGSRCSSARDGTTRLEFFRYATRITLSSFAGRPSTSGVSFGELTASEEGIASGHVLRITTA